jgi:hypothetical protein
LGGWDVYFFIPMSWILGFFIHFWTWAHGFAPSKALGGCHSEAEGTQSIQKISVPAPQILSPYLVKQNCQASRLLFAKICSLKGETILENGSWPCEGFEYL